jgi:hypothetical protein
MRDPLTVRGRFEEPGFASEKDVSCAVLNFQPHEARNDSESRTGKCVVQGLYGFAR